MHRLDQVYFHFAERTILNAGENCILLDSNVMTLVCAKRNLIPDLAKRTQFVVHSKRAIVQALSAACPARAARPGGPSGGSADLADRARAVKRIDALFDIERDINGLSAEKRLAARREEALRGTGTCFKVHERLA